jgi:hypothetical protein
MDIKKAALVVGSGSLVICALTCIWFVVNVTMCNYQLNQAVEEADKDSKEFDRQMEREREQIEASLKRSQQRMQQALQNIPIPSPPVQQVPAPQPAAGDQSWDPRSGMLPPGMETKKSRPVRALGDGGN